MNSIFDSELKEFLFYEIPKNIKGSVFAILLKEIDSITTIEKTCNCQLSGKIYEYFIGRDATAISELGAYFTNNHITNFICNEISPSLNEDGSIHTMIDMFGGSGGFTTGYIKHLQENFAGKINWTTQLSNVYHYDINEDVIKTAALEFFCLTGQIPDMNNMKYKNSFVDEFYGSNNKPQKFHYILTNPPYGGDKSKKSDAQVKREKIKDYIKKEMKTLDDKDVIAKRNAQLQEIERLDKQEKLESEKTKVSLKTCSQRIKQFAKRYNLKANDKEACSLILIMELLEENGTAVGVLKEGVFFDKKYKDLRKCLIENFNVRKIVSVPQDQFENTSTKTSIVIFDNTEEKTSQIEFSELIVEKYEDDIFEENNGNIVLVENKGDIKSVYEQYKAIAFVEDVVANDTSPLISQYYEKQPYIANDGFDLIPISDLCEIESGTSITKSVSVGGKYPVYGGGEATFYTDEYNRLENTILVSKTGMSKKCVRVLPFKVFLNSNGLSVMLKKNNDLLQRFIGYFMLSELCQNFIYEHCAKGSCQKALVMPLFSKLPIPIPRNINEISQIVNKMSYMYERKSVLEQKICNMEQEVIQQLKNLQSTFPIKQLNDLCRFKDGFDFYRKDMDDKKKHIQGYNLPILGIGGNIADYAVLNDKYNDYIAHRGDIVIGTKGTCGKVCKVSVEKAYYKHGIIKLYDFKYVSKDYLYYYLRMKLSSEYIEKNTNGSIVSILTLNTLKNIDIQIPSSAVQYELDERFKELNSMTSNIVELEEQFGKMIDELTDKAVVSV